MSNTNKKDLELKLLLKKIGLSPSKVKKQKFAPVPKVK